MKRGFNILVFLTIQLTIISLVTSILNAQNLQTIKFILLNVDQNRAIPEFDPLRDSTVINLSSLPTKNLNIKAVISPDTVGSVVFSFDGNTLFRVESGYPYVLAGDDNGRYLGMNFSAGWHRLTATPFTGPYGNRGCRNTFNN